MLKDLAGLLLGALLALFPARYRRHFAEGDVDLEHGAFLGAAAQLLVCLGFFIYGYLHFLQERVGAFAGTLIQHSAEEAMASETVQYGAGFVTLGEYLIRPTTWLLAYFAWKACCARWPLPSPGRSSPRYPWRW